MPERSCRFCGQPLTVTFADLGMSPPSNAFLKPEQLNQMERFYPLHAYVCSACKLVQLEEFESPAEIFSEYAYFSSFSDSWLKHAERYVGAMVDRFGLGPQSQVVEIASNDGYLLQYFKAARRARARRRAGRQRGQGGAGEAGRARAGWSSSAATRPAKLVADGVRADLLLGNNVLAHVPDLNDFVGGMPVLLKPAGVVTMEFPHLLRLIEQNQFDTIYHEHFSYLSFLTVEQVFARAGLRLFDVEELPTHGGSIRIYACHDGADHATSPRVERMRQLGAGARAGPDGRLHRLRGRRAGDQAGAALVPDPGQGRRKSVAAYGAAAKGNTLLNYCGVRADMLDYVVDKNPYKQGRFAPGVHIPVYGPGAAGRNQARLRADPAVEHAGRGDGADAGRPRLGRAVRGRDPEGTGAAMTFEPTPLAGAFVIAPELFRDERGFFAYTFDLKRFDADGLTGCIVQSNISFNAARGTLRGMHYQADPVPQPKLVRCTAGSIYDVIVDLRPASPTHRQWFGVELSSGQPPRPVRPGRVRPRVPDVGRRRRGAVRDVRPVRPGDGQRRPVRRPGIRHPLAAGRDRHQRPRPAVPRLPRLRAV